MKTKESRGLVGLLTAAMLFAGCGDHKTEPKESVKAGETIIENTNYVANLTDLDGDSRPDVLKIARKFVPSYGEPKVEFFVKSGYLARSPEPLPANTVVHLVNPEFFKTYQGLFTPNR